MLDLLIKFFVKDKAIKEKLELLAKTDTSSNSPAAKFLYFFAVMFMFGFFMMSVFSTVASFTFFILDEQLKSENIFLILGMVVGVILSYVFFRLMRKFWRKFKQPVEKELDLKL